MGSQMPAVAREHGQHVCQDIPVDVNWDGNVEESGAFREQSNTRWAKTPRREVEAMQDSEPRWMPPPSTL